MIHIQDSSHPTSVRRAAADFVLIALAWCAAHAMKVKASRIEGNIEVVEMGLRPVFGPAAILAYELALQWLK